MNQLISSSQRASPGHLRADPMIPMTFSASPFFVSFLAVITIAHCISSILVSLSIFCIRMCPPSGQGLRSLADHCIHRVQQRPAHRFCPFPWCCGFPGGGKKSVWWIDYFSCSFRKNWQAFVSEFGIPCRKVCYRVLKILFKQQTSLVVPSVLLMQGAQVPSLVRELDPTRCN